MTSLPRTIVLCLVLTLLAGCDCPNAGFSGQISTRDPLLGNFKLSRHSLLVQLPVVIHGREYPFLIDTGSTTSVYDTSIRSFLSEPVQSFTLHIPEGDIPLTSYSSAAARIGNYNLPTLSQVLCLDLERFREISGEKIYGLLGMDFLRGQVFRIDFDRGEVSFLRSAGSDSGVRMPVTFDYYSTPQAQITIPGLPGPEIFQIDTGDFGIGDGHLRARVFDFLAERGILKLGGHVRSETLAGSGIRKVGQVAEISLGCFRHKNLLFSRRSRVNSLGINYWSRYVVTFDFPNGTIYLKKGRQFDRIDD
jgi:hypothetical protein